MSEDSAKSASSDGKDDDHDDLDRDRRTSGSSESHRAQSRLRRHHLRTLRLSPFPTAENDALPNDNFRRRRRGHTNSSNEAVSLAPYMASESSGGESSDASLGMSSDAEESSQPTQSTGGNATRSRIKSRRSKQRLDHDARGEVIDKRRDHRDLSPERKAEARVMAPKERATFFQDLRNKATRKMKLRLLASRIIVSASYVWAGFHLWKTKNDSGDERLQVIANAYNFLGLISLIYAVFTPSTLYNRVFTTDERTYRDEPQDGALIGFLLPPLASAARLIVAYKGERNHKSLGSLFEPGKTSAQSKNGARILLSFNLLASLILFGNALLSRAIPAGSINRRNRIRIWVYSAGSWIIALLLAGVRYMTPEAAHDLGPLDILYAALAYQLLLYWNGRLMRKSFTFGELGIVASGGAFTLFEAATVSFVRLNREVDILFSGLAKHPLIRSPSPIVVLNLAAILGPFVVGTLLWPILAYNRHLAQRPIHKVRSPSRNNYERQIIALVCYALSALIIWGLVGKWCQWVLALNEASTMRWGSSPWSWAVKFVLYDGGWTRRVLLAHWIVVVSVGIAVIQHQASKDRDQSMIVSDPSPSEEEDAVTSDLTPASIGLRKKIRTKSVGGGRLTTNKAVRPAIPKRSIAGRGVAVALNLQRKFFHALALIMFVPGVVFDLPFLHIALSVAFAVFSLVEVVRYFALWPFGATIHLFLTQFLDSRDSGPVILSHFYLLGGCALPIWFGGPSKLANLSGILILGVGDSAASIIGKRYGRTNWPDSHKTLEGTAALIVSVVFCALALEKIAWIEHFSRFNYIIAVTIAGITEAVSNQNDNLIIPILLWSLLSSTTT